jgi:formylmethanofuran dehydrogenase subunit B
MQTINDSCVAAEGAAAIAELLAESRQVLFVVDAIDLAGAAAVVQLARQLDATIDHSEPIALGMSREKGWLGTAAGEAHLRADTCLYVGAIDRQAVEPGAARRLLEPERGRTDLYIGTPNATAKEQELTWLTAADEQSHMVIGLLRATLKGHQLQLEEPRRSAIAAFAATLQAARYGIALYGARQLDELAVESLAGLVDELSKTTRWSLLQIGSAKGQAELLRMTQALAGMSPPITFAGARARHEPWLAGARHIIARGEADLVVWISASDRAIPTWLTRAPKLAAITANHRRLAGSIAQLEIGIGGTDHPALSGDNWLEGFRLLPPAHSSDRPSAAAALAALAAELRLANKGAA